MLFGGFTLDKIFALSGGSYSLKQKGVPKKETPFRSILWFAFSTVGDFQFFYFLHDVIDIAVSAEFVMVDFVHIHQVLKVFGSDFVFSDIPFAKAFDLVVKKLTDACAYAVFFGFTVADNDKYPTDQSRERTAADDGNHNFHGDSPSCQKPCLSVGLLSKPKTVNASRTAATIPEIAVLHSDPMTSVKTRIESIWESKLDQKIGDFNLFCLIS